MTRPFIILNARSMDDTQKANLIPSFDVCVCVFYFTRSRLKLIKFHRILPLASFIYSFACSESACKYFYCYFLHASYKDHIPV